MKYYKYYEIWFHSITSIHISIIRACTLCLVSQHVLIRCLIYAPLLFAQCFSNSLKEKEIKFKEGKKGKELRQLKISIKKKYFPMYYPTLESELYTWYSIHEWEKITRRSFDSRLNRESKLFEKHWLRARL